MKSKTIKRAFVLFLLCGSLQLHAQKDKPEYAVTKIPVELFADAHTVTREDHATFEMKGLDHTIFKGKIVKTILNKKGDHNAAHRIFYDGETSVKTFSGALYDKHGKLVRRLKNSDIHDYSAISSSSIYEDNRVKTAELLYPGYPFTVEFEFEVEFENSFYIPSWFAVSSHSEAVMHSSYKIMAPKSYNLRYKEHNYPGTVVKTEREGVVEYFWEIKNYKAIEPESYMPRYTEIVPWVDVAPSGFVLSGHQGNSNTWKSFGEFFWKLNQGRDEIPPEVETELKTLTANAATTRKKVKLVYQYLQNSTRYISIQLGIGGYQPFEASYVKANGYGDCKALSNYMYSMLKSLGIYSIYTLVLAGDDKADIDYNFPSNQFNHVILCVPNAGDTLWLECTNQTAPFGYLGTFTMDRHVLLITENGGVIAKTPAFDAEKNLQLRNAAVELHEDGSAASVVKTQYEGYQYENIWAALDKGEEAQKRFLYENMSLSGFEISDFKFSQQKASNPKAFEELHLKMRRYATLSGKRIFFQPNLMNHAGKLDKPQEERKFDMELHFPYTDIDTVEYSIPEGYHLEFLPEPVDISSEFGAYQAKVIQEEGKVIYIRKRVAFKGKYAAEKYLSFVEYVNKIANADRIKLVLVKET